MNTEPTRSGDYDYSQRAPRLPPAVDESNLELPIDLGVRIKIYELQQVLRQFEKRAYDLFLQNLVKGTSHLSLGMEAVAAGFGLAMRSDDYSFATPTLWFSSNTSRCSPPSLKCQTMRSSTT